MHHRWYSYVLAVVGSVLLVLGTLAFAADFLIGAARFWYVSIPVALVLAAVVYPLTGPANDPPGPAIDDAGAPLPPPLGGLALVALRVGMSVAFLVALILAVGLFAALADIFGWYVWVLAAVVTIIAGASAWTWWDERRKGPPPIVESADNGGDIVS